MRTGGLGLLLLVLVGFNWAQDVCCEKRPCDCGRVIMQSSIDGKSGKIIQYPWLVAIVSEAKEEFCAGTIISHRWVLTAAHCFDAVKDQKKVVIHADVLKLYGDGRKPVLRHVMKIVRNEYDNNMRNNILLIQLRTPLKFSQGIQPVCLPAPQSYEGLSAISAGLHVKDSGEPESNAPLEIDFRIRRNHYCRKHYKANNFTLEHEMFCSTCTKKLNEKCEGNSGGPLATSCNGHYVQVGVDWGSIICKYNDSGLYTNVSQYQRWIWKTARKSRLCYHKCK